MDEFSFEELIADMLDITDKQREDDYFIFDKFCERFGFDILLKHYCHTCQRYKQD